MDLYELTPDLSVSPQITVEDLADLASAGFRLLIINRPDEEAGPALAHTVIAEEAAKRGIETRFIPFHPGELTSQMIEDFAEALATPGPKLAYCRSGHRSTVLWALTQAGKLPEAEILERGARAGHDLSPILPMLAARARD